MKVHKGKCADYGIVTGLRHSHNAISVVGSMNDVDLRSLLDAFIETAKPKKQKAAKDAAAAFFRNIRFMTRVEFELLLALSPGVDFKHIPPPPNKK